MKRLDARLLAGVAVTAALLVPLAIFGGPALASSTSSASQYQYSGSAQYQYRVLICHITGSKKHPAHTITVSARAVRAHLRHGDHLGACTGTETPRTHGHGHGQPAAAHHDNAHHGESGDDQGNSGKHHK
jgi:hypothetical protein